VPLEDRLDHDEVPARKPAGELVVPPHVASTELLGMRKPPPPKNAERSVRREAAAPAGQLWVGNSTGFKADPARPQVLLRHVGIVAGAERGRIAAALNLVELLETGADELAQADGDNPLRQGRVEDLVVLLSNVDVFTPGAEPLTAATLLRPAAGAVSRSHSSGGRSRRHQAAGSLKRVFAL
jgi:hypothetical protein